MKSKEDSASDIVCLVDDDPAVLKSIARLLVSDGFKVQTFNEPKNFLAYVAEHRAPLAILDIWMEQMNGLEVQAKLARTSPATRVIIITGRKDEGVERTALECGASAFFMKPLDDVPFLEAVRTALSSGLTNGGALQ